MKSIFKRAFAAVTSSALVFSQIAATAANINAADLPLTVNKAWVLNVPFDQKASGSKEEGSALKNYLDLAQMEVKTESDVEALVFKTEEAKLSNLLSSRWNDELDSLMSTRLGSKDSITQKTDAAQLKQLIKKSVISNFERNATLLKEKMNSSIRPSADVSKVLDRLTMIDENTAKKIEDAIHGEGTMTISADGTATETVVIDEIGPVIGNAMAKFFEKYFENVSGQKFVNEDGTPINFDWSDYHIFGTVEIKAEYGNFDKNIKYSVVFTDEKGNKITSIDALTEYVMTKWICESEDGKELGGMNIMQRDTANANIMVKTFVETVASDMKKTFEKKEIITEVADMIQGISFEVSDPNDAYDEYIKQLEEGLGSVGISEGRVKKLVDTFNAKRPENIYDAADKVESNQMIAKAIEQGIGFIHKIAGDKAKVELTVTDVTDILKSGTNWQMKFPNGYSSDNMFDYKLEAEELASLKDAVIKYKEADIEAEYNKRVKDVEAHRRITLNTDNDYNAFNGNGFYNVEVVIDKIILEDVVETTVTTTGPDIPGTEPTTGPTTGPSGIGTTETTPEGGSGATTETTPEGGSGATTETTPEGGSGATTETTPEGGSGATTETTPEGGSGATTETTPEGGSGSESTSETTGTETSTIPVSSLEFIQSGMPGELVYWSEETSDFTFTNMKVTMNIYKLNDDKTDYVLDKSADVTAAFEPNAKSPKDFEFKGFDQYTIDYKVKDTSLISEQITLAGYNAEALMKQDGIVTGFKAKGSTPLYLVLRGDSNLDNEIDITDAKWALDYQVATAQTNYTMKQAFEKNLIKAKDNNYNNLKFQHYAADVFNGDGLIETRDAKAILDYFVAVKQTNLPGAEEWTYQYYLMQGAKVIPNAQLHADPLRFDTQADYAEDDAAHINAE